jgi:hypothetical protein
LINEGEASVLAGSTIPGIVDVPAGFEVVCWVSDVGFIVEVAVVIEAAAGAGVEVLTCVVEDLLSKLF